MGIRFDKIAPIPGGDPAKTSKALDLGNDSPKRRQFLARLSGELAKRSVVDVLRKGVDHGPLHLTLFYGTPSEGNANAQRLFAENRFSVTRQLRYSLDETRRALDLGLFVNGLPVGTFELKSNLTKQTVDDAVELLKDDTEFYKQFVQNESFRRYVTDLVHDLTVD